MKPGLLLALVLLNGVPVDALRAYPLDGYAQTGIARVEAARLAHIGLIEDTIKQPPGALLSTDQVDIRLRAQQDFTFPPVDAELTSQIRGLLGENAGHYAVTLMDLSDLTQPRYAAWRGDQKQNVGSVGKLLVALGFFQALKDAYPEDSAGLERAAVLKNTLVTADDFSQWDHHSIRLFDPATRVLRRHVLQVGDRANQWQYLDWMLSISSNAAAAMNQRQGMLLRQFRKDFPIPEDAIAQFFQATPARELTALYKHTFWDPVSRNGMDLAQFRQGSFFTVTGNKKVNGGGKSYANARMLMEFMVKMEQGQLVDEWSSQQIKRLLYMTEHRIRYASSPALKNAAVYFKSGSLYSCKHEKGFRCSKYRGNVKNYMNSVAVVESPAVQRKLFYIVIVISNVLRINSAVAHQTLATQIHHLIEAAHPQR